MRIGSSIYSGSGIRMSVLPLFLGFGIGSSIAVVCIALGIGQRINALLFLASVPVLLLAFRSYKRIGSPAPGRILVFSAVNLFLLAALLAVLR